MSQRLLVPFDLAAAVEESSAAIELSDTLRALPSLRSVERNDDGTFNLFGSAERGEPRVLGVSAETARAVRLARWGM